MTAWKRMFVGAAAAAGLALATVPAGAQTGGGTPSARTGFRVETLIMELSSFLPEEYARLRAGPGGPGGGSGGPQSAQPPAAGQQSAQPGQHQSRFSLPQFKRDSRLMLTAAQVDALIPVLQDLQQTPFPTPSQAKKVTTTVDATLTKQQKDAYDAYAKERDKAIEDLRKQYQSRGGFQQGTPGSAGGQGVQGGQRPQVDPAELRRRMLDQFIKNLRDYRTALK
jgi:hypothetical protein